MRAKVLIGGAIGDVGHEPGDIIEGSVAQVEAWVAAGIAEPLRTTRKAEAQDA